MSPRTPADTPAVPPSNHPGEIRPVTRAEFQEHLSRDLATHGEQIWDKSVVTHDRVFQHPMTTTSTLIGSLNVAHGYFHDWNGRGLATHLDSHLRVHLGRHEFFTEKGNLADGVAFKTIGPFSQEHLQFARVPRSLWAHAKFVCPYCETLCTWQASCGHLFSYEGLLLQTSAASPAFERTFEMMRRGGTIPNLPNLQLPGIRIKGEAVPFGMNWVRASCIYAETPQSLEPFLAAIAAYFQFVGERRSP